MRKSYFWIDSVLKEGFGLMCLVKKKVAAEVSRWAGLASVSQVNVREPPTFTWLSEEPLTEMLVFLGLSGKRTQVK